MLKMLLKILLSVVILLETEAKVRHSGRLLARPNPVKCSRRPQHLQEKSTGHNYFISEASNFKVSRTLWKLIVRVARWLCIKPEPLCSSTQSSMS